MAILERHVTAPYLLIIDTDQYAGNFERELTGFCTGQHNCTHGDREAEDFDDYIEDNEVDNGWEHKVISNTDNEGHSGVCSIWPTPGRLNNGTGGHRDAAPGETGWPAYESVVIFLNQPPTAEDMKLFRIRLDDFASDQMHFGRRTGKKLVIKNIRLVKRETTIVDTEVPLP
jgi:hypothetical protein